MTIDVLREFLLWCTLINAGLLLLWVVLFAAAGDRVYRLHSRWFRMSNEQFNAIQYTGMATFKLAIFLLNLVPYAALSIIA